MTVSGRYAAGNGHGNPPARRARGEPQDAPNIGKRHLGLTIPITQQNVRNMLPTMLLLLAQVALPAQLPPAAEGAPEPAESSFSSQTEARPARPTTAPEDDRIARRVAGFSAAGASVAASLALSVGFWLVLLSPAILLAGGLWLGDVTGAVVTTDADGNAVKRPYLDPFVGAVFLGLAAQGAVIAPILSVLAGGVASAVGWGVARILGRDVSLWRFAAAGAGSSAAVMVGAVMGSVLLLGVAVLAWVALAPIALVFASGGPSGSRGTSPEATALGAVGFGLVATMVGAVAAAAVLPLASVGLGHVVGALLGGVMASRAPEARETTEAPQE